jgi:hypothetical protein
MVWVMPVIFAREEMIPRMLMGMESRMHATTV